MTSKTKTILIGVFLILLLVGFLGYKYYKEHKADNDYARPQVTPKDGQKYCYIYFAADDSSKVVCTDENNKYIPGVHRVNLFVEVSESTPVARLFIWQGYYKPTEVRAEDRKVAGVIVVSPENFQQIVDQEGIAKEPVNPPAEVDSK